METIARLLRIVTSWGWTLVGVAVLGAILGTALGWRELVVVAAASVLLLLAAVPWVVGQRYVEAEVTVSAERVPVGAAAQAVLRVRRPGRALPPTAIDVLIGDETYRIELPRLDPGDSWSHRITLDTRVRGRIVVGPATILRDDPFGILERTHVLTGSTTLVVHPRVARIPAMAAGLVRDLEGDTAAELTADDVAFHSLREYMPGDDPRHIHWRSSARSGSLLVRQYEPTKRSDTLVCLSTSAADYAGEEDFELALSVAATVGVGALLERRSLRVVESPAARDLAIAALDARTRDRLLDALTDLAADRELGIADVARSVALAPHASVAWLVVGSAVSARTLREAASMLPPDIACIVLRADAAAPPAVGRLGGVPVITVGLLQDLGRGLGLGRFA